VRRLVNFIEARGGRITARELQRSNNRKYLSATQAEAVLNALTPVYGDWEEEPAATVKGRPSAKCFVLRTTHDARQKSSSANGAGEASLLPKHEIFVVRRASCGGRKRFFGEENRPLGWRGRTSQFCRAAHYCRAAPQQC
jgi:hypothetical protein